MNHHDDMDDMADFAHSRIWPGESSTEIGAEPDYVGCGTQGTGLGPWGWLTLGIALFCGIAAIALPYFTGGQ